MTPSEGNRPRFLAGAGVAFFGLLLLAEIGSRYAVRSGFLYRTFDFSGTLTSLPELRDRVAWAGSRARPAFVLGDSVLGASALVEHRIPDARRRTVPAFLERNATARGWSVESLGADGLLLPDLEAICLEVRKAGPRRLVVVLNFRMFADEFQKPSEALSRDFLARDLGTVLPAIAAAAGSDSLDARLDAWSVEGSFLMRTTRLLKPLWFFPTRRDFYRRLTERVVGAPDDADMREAALRLRVAHYYESQWNDSAPAFRFLDALLETARGLDRAIVVLTPQNPDFIQDPDTFASNRRLLAAFVASRAGRTIEYRDLSERYPADRFLDHCHLTADGNRDYAAELAGLIAS